MSTVSSKFGLSAPTLPGKSSFVSDTICVGIELEQEYESERHFIAADGTGSPYAKSLWRVDRDDSLRGHGIEYASVVLYPAQIEPALDEVWSIVEQGNNSWRAGIHVHVDVRSLDDAQFRSMCKLYAIMEPLIFAWEGTGRDQSRFCIPWYSCTDGVAAAFDAVSQDRRTIERTFRSFGKYAALNLMPIMNYGSVEFRHMSMMPDRQRLLNYVRICMGIVEAGSRNVNASREMSGLGPREFISSIFQGHCDFLLQVPDYEMLLWRGMDTANALGIQNRDVGMNQYVRFNNFLSSFNQGQ